MTDPPQPKTSAFSFRRVLVWLGVARAQDGGIALLLRPLLIRGGTSLFIVLVAALAWMYRYSTSPSFCDSCHIMAPYYQAWKTSSHNFVSCIMCHYPPGTRQWWVKFQALSQVVKYVTRTYSSKPYAEIEDASCLREGCHTKRLLEGKVLTRTGVHFDHTPHLKDLRRGKQLRCTSCHSQIVIGEHIEVTYSTCYLCHFRPAVEGHAAKPLAGCVSCHPAPEQDIRVGEITFNHRDFTAQPGNRCENCHFDIVQGQGEAPKDRCYTCHNQPERLAKYADIDFIHTNHVSLHNVECTQCHFRIEHRISQPTPLVQTQCNMCHAGQHLSPAAMYRGEGGRGVKSRPSPMFLAQVDCVGCHLQPMHSGPEAELSGQTRLASEQGCLNCHGEAFQGILAEWQDTLNQETNSIQAKLARVNQRLAAAGPQSAGNCRERLPDAIYNLDFIRFARGVHNVDYALDLLHQAEQTLDQCLQSLGPIPPAPPKTAPSP